MMCPSKKTHLKDMQTKPLVKVKQSSILFYSHSTYHCPSEKMSVLEFCSDCEATENLDARNRKD